MHNSTLRQDVTVRGFKVRFGMKQNGHMASVLPRFSIRKCNIRWLTEKMTEINTIPRSTMPGQVEKLLKQADFSDGKSRVSIKDGQLVPHDEDVAKILMEETLPFKQKGLSLIKARYYVPI